MGNPLVSIIIPTYNRARLIGETLDSVLNQTYEDWECIIVDDGSTDNTEEVVNKYIINEPRFQFYHRPINYKSGGNGARNYGFEVSKGDFIIFFDSDDLMTEDHVKLKAEYLVGSSYDYVITKTKYFNAKIDLDAKYYNFTSADITPYNYISQQINWLTPDVCLKSGLAKQIAFNEELKSKQEYNYFSKLVLISTNAFFTNDITTLRRHHINSIRGQLDASLRIRSSFQGHWVTFIEIQNKSSINIQKHLLKVCVSLLFHNTSILKSDYVFKKKIIEVFGIKAFYFFIAIFLKRKFNKGYCFIKKLY